MDLMSETRIDSVRAQEIVRNFLAQSQAVLDVKEPVLEDHTWRVEADVVSFGFSHIRKVKVDAETGRIIGYDTVANPKTFTR